MKFKVQVALLVGCMVLTASGNEIVDMDIVTEIQLEDENGQVLTVTKESSTDCLFQKYTSVIDDVIHVVVQDFNVGISLSTMSENPDVCYVRELTEDEENKNKLCKNGYLRTKEKLPRRIEKEFTVGEEMPLENLPSNARDLCEGRRALKLNAKRSELQNSDVSELANKNQEKRACITTVTETTEYRCDFTCTGWGWGKRCGQNCKNYVIEKLVRTC